ncbi:MAG: phage/plasmid primase, P4 family, partial [Verrucomicrobiae bacterium]
FDANPDILVVLNGTLDFAEGLFREHRPGDRATVRSPIAFDPESECSKWEGFLARFFPDVETRVYLARAVGYSLTGRVHADALFFAHGKGANGKSTFFGVLKILLGELMTTVPIAALLAAKSDNNFDYHKASMEGKRVVLTDEIPESRSLADSQVKAITGGDPINARRPFEQPYCFMPTHKLWLMGNHKPEIKGTDEGIWRRVHMIPFLVTIAESDRRPRHEILAEFGQEAGGILNWAIRGLLESRDIGLRPPPQVVEATKEFREESDQFGAFLVECTEKDIMGRVKISSLSQCYGIWCDQNNETPRYRGTRKLRSAMVERGYAIEPDKNDHPTVVSIRLKLEESQNQFKLHES